MWAIGIVFYSILFGKQPFKGKTEKEFIKQITKGDYKFPKNSDKKENQDKKQSNKVYEYSDDSKNIISDLLQKEPEMRLTAK